MTGSKDVSPSCCCNCRRNREAHRRAETPAHWLDTRWTQARLHKTKLSRRTVKQPMTEGTKHNPFQSIYRENFEVVEQRRGKVRWYPHTEQLPVLLRALN